MLAAALAAVVAVWVAVQITPAQSVHVAGQTVRVSAVRPDFRPVGPGELDLFGERLQTRPQFAGPLRPRLELTGIDPVSAVPALASPATRQRLRDEVFSDLLWGWARYFGLEAAIAALFAAMLLAAFAGVRANSRRKIALWALAGAIAATGLNVGGVLLSVQGARHVLAHVKDLADLVGTSPLPAGQVAAGVVGSPSTETVVVLGDSVAAGVGNTPLTSPSLLDAACGRSADAFSAVLAQVNSWKVDNLACGGASVSQGLLGPEPLKGMSSPAQLPAVQHAPALRAVIVNAGANDVQWGAMLRLCAAASRCDDQASAAFFRQELALLSGHLRQALGQLAALHNHPLVVVNQYYDPFGADVSCLLGIGLTPAKVQVLRARLAQLNNALADGARAFGFATATPNFTGRTLCTPQSDVQGPGAPAPFHPTAAGQFLLALADERALLGPRPSVPPAAPGSAADSAADRTSHPVDGLPTSQPR